METLKLILKPDKENKEKFNVYANQHGETDSLLPFFDSESNWRMTVLRALHISDFDRRQSCKSMTSKKIFK